MPKNHQKRHPAGVPFRTAIRLLSVNPDEVPGRTYRTADQVRLSIHEVVTYSNHVLGCYRVEQRNLLSYDILELIVVLTAYFWIHCPLGSTPDFVDLSFPIGVWAFLERMPHVEVSAGQPGIGTAVGIESSG